MRKINELLFLIIVFVLSACATKVNFPVSTIVPAADISAKIEKKSNNYIVDILATSLANPERLSPPSNFYVVWVVTDAGSVRNLGQLTTNRNGSNTLKTIVPYAFNQIIITSEVESDVQFPSSREITRINVRLK